MAEFLEPEIVTHYTEVDEAVRLAAGRGKLEFLRSWEIIHRFLPPPPAVVLDVGGGTGSYALPLADEGYDVHLYDAVDIHVAAARRLSSRGEGQRPLASIAQADARDLPFEGKADAVLLFGPIYHLVQRQDRLAALREAARVLRTGGHLFVAAISFAASTLDGLTYRQFEEEGFEEIVEGDVADGHHRNPTNNPFWFTTAYFHRPQELVDEIVEAGFELEALVVVEGPAQMLTDIDRRLNDPARTTLLLDAIRRIESEPSLLGATGHLIAVARVS